MFKKLRTIIYYAPALEAVKAWYTKITGKQPYFDQPFYVGFDINGFELGLDPNAKVETKGNQTVAYWAVDDINQAFEKLITEGATQVQGITDVGEGIKIAVLTDPWGNTLGIIQEP